jgi:glucose-6-phosphate isomerase
MMKDITLDLTYAKPFITEEDYENMKQKVQLTHEQLKNCTGKGAEFTGWLDLPRDIEKSLVDKIIDKAEEIKEMADAFIVIGVGGSYLGARSVIKSLTHTFHNQVNKDLRKAPEIYFVGQNLSSTYLTHLLEVIKNKRIVVNVISKSGTTLEPALAFRFFKAYLEEHYGVEEAKKRIIATTDAKKGVLKELADLEGYDTFVVPDDIGGRYSVLTPVGLLPIAVSGINVRALLEGAKVGSQNYQQISWGNPCYEYVTTRHLLYKGGKTVELLATYEPELRNFSEWWKQLYGESEGKEGKGIFPASVSFTTDLHSLGQYVQEGLKQLFVTTLWVESPRVVLPIPKVKDAKDGLNYLEGKNLDYVNSMACEGAILAHSKGGVPNIKLNLPELTAYYMGMLIYFFEKSCAISGYLLDINPFDQPGVEAYKKNMYQLLGK